MKELLELNSPLAHFERAMPYVIPDGYFDAVSNILAEGAQLAEGADPLFVLSKAMPFAVPDGYLSALLQNPTIISSADNSGSHIGLPFDVPQEYFNTLPDVLLASVQAADIPAKKQKAIVFNPSWRHWRTIQWATAAMLVLGLSLGSYKYFQSAPPDSVTANQLSRLDRDDINSYIEQQVDDFDADVLEASVVADNSDMKTSVSELEDDEIRDYLYNEPEVNNPNTLN